MFGLSLHILDLIEHFIQAHVSALSVAVECDRANGILKILLKDNSTGVASVSDAAKGSPLKHMKNSSREIDLKRLNDTASKTDGIFKIGKGEVGEAIVTGTVKLDSIKGDIHDDLAVMLSSIVCTNPDLDLTFEFRICEENCSMRVSDIKNRLPPEKSGGLTLARAVQEKIKAELEVFKEFQERRSILNFTVCPFCSCGCQAIPRKSVQGNLTGLVPSRRHPVSAGSLCIRGWNSVDYIYHPDRIDAPMIKKDGGQIRCTWKEALETAAEDLKNVLHKWGPDSIGFIGSPRCSNEDNYLLMKMARQVVGTGNIDTGSRLTYSPIFEALYDSYGIGASTTSLENVSEAELILLVGADVTGCSPKAASRIFQALNRKATLIVVDPRCTKIAKQATHHWKIRPGSDAYWISGMISYLIKENKVRADLLGGENAGFMELKKEAGLFPMSLAETKTWIPEDSLRMAADLLASVKKAVFILGDGIGSFDEMKKTVYGLANLAFITGHGGRNGSGILVVGGENNTQGAWDMGALPDRLPGGIPIAGCDVETRARLNFRMPPTVGQDYRQILHGVMSGDIRALYVMGENLLAFHEEDKAFSDALGRLELLVVQEIFSNPLTAMATVVFPASAPYERAGTVTNLERRVQRFQPIVKSRGDTRPDWEIIYNLSKAMGAGFTYRTVWDVNAEIASCVPFYEGLNPRLPANDENGFLWPKSAKNENSQPRLRQNWEGTIHGSYPQEGYGEETDEEFPVVLILGRLPSFWNTGTRSSRCPLLHREENRSHLQLHPYDANRFQVREGEKVRIIHRSGIIHTSAVLKEDLPAGVAFLALHSVDGRFAPTGVRRIPIWVES
ncbi:MAG: molybdopterin-dependent oxidoreductase [Acidobacteria bacterium]|nr:molybdopterin-dependent oxidoreductase [Acidobacteriota bacterium]